MSDTPDAVTWLREHGPATVADSPFTGLKTSATRRAGVRKLHPQGDKNSRDDVPAVGVPKAVFYLPDAHSNREVVDAFFAANPAHAELSSLSLMQRFPTEFHTAVHEWRAEHKRGREPKPPAEGAVNTSHDSEQIDAWLNEDPATRPHDSGSDSGEDGQ